MASRQELLRELWVNVINVNMLESSLSSVVDNCARDPEGPFGDVGPAITRILAAGASPRDFALVCRHAAYEAVFSTLYSIGDPGVDDDDVFMLHEELLGSDPSGLEGCPGSSDVT